MKIVVNGEQHETDAGTVREFVQQIALPPQTILVEHNGIALRQDEWDERQLGKGDRLEIIRIVAGG